MVTQGLRSRLKPCDILKHKIKNPALLIFFAISFCFENIEAFVYLQERPLFLNY